MSDLHVIIGAGPVGRATAVKLASEGHDVPLVSRSGRGPEIAGVRRAAADAADADRLTELATGAVALYNCINPPSYTVWTTYWPPVAAAFLEAAERSGATLVIASCLYGYGPVDGPMVEGMPDAATGTKARIRAGMWADALAAHEAGRIRAVEVRGSDYVGPWVTNAHIAQVARVPWRAGACGSSAAPTSRTRSPMCGTWAARSPRSRRRRGPGAGSGTRRPTRRAPRPRPSPTSAGLRAASRSPCGSGRRRC